MNTLLVSPPGTRPHLDFCDVTARDLLGHHRLRALPVADDGGGLLGRIDRRVALGVLLSATAETGDADAPSLVLSALDAVPPHTKQG